MLVFATVALPEALHLPGGPGVPGRLGNETAQIWAKVADGTSSLQRSLGQDVCTQLHEPSSAAYKLWQPEKKQFSQFGQDKRLIEVLAPIFKNKSLFFIESGAADGEYNSNTLYFEREMGWTGLLVEPHPTTFKELLAKNRKAHMYNGAISTTGSVGTMELILKHCLGVAGYDDGECSHLAERQPVSVSVPLAPLETMLACLGRTTVDFWSLDVEGVEGKILDKFPFKDIEVGSLMIEANKNGANNKEIEDAMARNGFQRCGKTVIDWIYINPAYFTKRALPVPEKC